MARSVSAAKTSTKVGGAPEPALARYWAKRDFAVTAEPEGETSAPKVGRARRRSTRAGAAELGFVIQKHAASRLHYDFRLELDGVLVSWAVPKGPSYDPADKRMAIHVEDHPVSYADFEGTIPPGQYGAGQVIVWDRGRWEPVGDPRQGLAKGKLLFRLHGQKLQGLWELVRIARGDEKQEPWILFKKRDGLERPRADYDVVSAMPDSVLQSVPGRASKAKATGGRKLAPVGPAATRQPPVQAELRGRNTPVPVAVRSAPLPARLKPQLATLAASVPDGDWIYEIKFDGYRMLARLEHGRAAMITRGGHDWSAKMPHLVAQLEALGVDEGFLDGEIVVLDSDGLPDFNALQNAFDKGRGAQEIVYFLFDVPFLGGYDLRELPLRERRKLLQGVLARKGTDHLRFSEDFTADAGSVLASACRLNLEGVIAKRADAPYVTHRSETWLKLKCKLRQEFVVCGYTRRSDGAAQIGSLLLGVRVRRTADPGGQRRNWMEFQRRGGTTQSRRAAEARQGPLRHGAGQARPLVAAFERRRGMDRAEAGGGGEFCRVDP